MSEALRLADLMSAMDCEDTIKAAAELRRQSERIAELEAANTEIIQAITDPENQPSQYGTVTIGMHEEDGFVIERMGQLLARTVLILRGPPPELVRWSYHDIPARVEALAAELRRLHAEVEVLRADAERYRWLRKAHWANATLCCVLDPKANVRLGAMCPSGENLDCFIDAARKEST